jgi:aspartate ammonia-lyase
LAAASARRGGPRYGAVSPPSKRGAVIGYDKASKITHSAINKDLTLKEAALKLAFATEAEFDRVVDPAKMVHPYVARAS